MLKETLPILETLRLQQKRGRSGVCSRGRAALLLRTTLMTLGELPPRPTLPRTSPQGRRPSAHPCGAEGPSGPHVTLELMRLASHGRNESGRGWSEGGEDGRRCAWGGGVSESEMKRFPSIRDLAPGSSRPAVFPKWAAALGSLTSVTWGTGVCEQRQGLCICSFS